ncbi:hypothetical protein PAPYR_2586 [Paratrimastix pyriformis]|uniref:Uncharacterized protein n=1 Tax=Paratrimastix pyriformis TaxID=342808 RepID=A0ABQ8UWI9_9EUKA|nr:hypothetical protein PAPYR_2586 [Paratrimastix pyriformis]
MRTMNYRSCVELRGETHFYLPPLRSVSRLIFFAKLPSLFSLCRILQTATRVRILEFFTPYQLVRGTAGIAKLAAQWSHYQTTGLAPPPEAEAITGLLDVEPGHEAPPKVEAAGPELGGLFDEQPAEQPPPAPPEPPKSRARVPLPQFPSVETVLMGDERYTGQTDWYLSMLDLLLPAVRCLRMSPFEGPPAPRPAPSRLAASIILRGVIG